MQSDLIEYSRFNQLDTGVLGVGNLYLRARACEPILEVRSPFDHNTLLRTLGRLRYGEDLSETKKQSLIRTLSDDIRKFFIDPKTATTLPVQWDLVFNAAELGLVPFEALLNDDDTPVFACESSKIILTRRIRQSSLPADQEIWPAIPRVLFAYARGTAGGHEVPYKEHLASLRESLRPWLSTEMMAQSDNAVLTILSDARFSQIADCLNNAIAGNKPYTHVHILAHGVRIELPDDTGSEFGVALFKIATIDDFSSLFHTLKVKPFVVTYMICDSANASNPVIPRKNIVQVTHHAGVPVVIGSQLPLTFPGSVRIADVFYKSILNGQDVRDAIHQARCSLFKNKDTGHDWLSLIAYVRLPEGYESSLKKSVLSREMEALKTIRKDTETLIDGENHIERARYEEMFALLKERLNVLLNHITNIAVGRVHHELMQENAGMIGSCYKRLAELIFYTDRGASTHSASLSEQITYLNEALHWYREAADSNLSHHWSVVQYLSLDRILNAGKGFAEYRSSAKLGASKAIDRGQGSEKVWGWGSLAELCLLSGDDEWPVASALARNAMEGFIKEARLLPDPASYLTSMALQFNRYIRWWIPENGFNDPSQFPLSDRARELIDVCKTK